MNLRVKRYIAKYTKKMNLLSENGTTSNFDLINLAKRLGIKLILIGFKDQFKGKTPRPGAYIINLESSDEGNGTHWCALYLARNKNKREAFYSDSFGIVPPNEIMDFMRRWTNNSKNIHINNSTIQDPDVNYCGEYAIHFLGHMQKQPTLNNFKYFFKTYKKIF